MPLSPMPTDDKFLTEGKEISEPWRKLLGEMTSPYLPYDKFQAKIYTVSTLLRPSDFGKIIKMDNGANNVICTLPSVNEKDIGAWVGFLRLGTGSLTIQAADSDTIEKSSAGGKLVCNETGRVAANLIIHLVTATKWAILWGTGIWQVY